MTKTQQKQTKKQKLKEYETSINLLKDFIERAMNNKRPNKKKRQKIVAALEIVSKTKEYKPYVSMISRLSKNVEKPIYPNQIWEYIVDMCCSLKPVIECNGKSNIYDLLTELLDGNIKVNTENNSMLSKLLIEGKKINMCDFRNVHTMYMFATCIRTIDYDDNRLDIIIIKMGYAYDLLKRLKSLESEYFSPFFLLHAKVVAAEQDEKAFHTLIQDLYGKLHIKNFKINGKEKIELYIFDIRIVKEFIKFETVNMSDKVHDRVMIDSKIKLAIIEGENLDKNLAIEQNKTEQEKQKTEQEKQKTIQGENTLALAKTELERDKIAFKREKLAIKNKG